MQRGVRGRAGLGPGLALPGARRTSLDTPAERERVSAWSGALGAAALLRCPRPAARLGRTSGALIAALGPQRQPRWGRRRGHGGGQAELADRRATRQTRGETN